MESIKSHEEKERHYRWEISRRSPPGNHHDEFMIRVYEGLLHGIMELRRFEGAGDQPLAEHVD